jgi:hypothetical protein
MHRKFKVAVWYDPKKRFITLEGDISQKEAMRRYPYLFKDKDLKVFVIEKKRKLRKVI